MKKLNRKGFTLIELLAIIVILAIIMVVTLPTMLDSMSSAKTGQLSNAAASVEDWFKKQNTLVVMGKDATGNWVASSTFTDYLDDIGDNDGIFEIGDEDFSKVTTEKNLTVAALEAAGIADPAKNLMTATDAAAGVAVSTVKYNGGKACVTLVAKPGGSFYVEGDTSRSSGC